MTVLRLLVLGDSLSEGVGDPVPGLPGFLGRLRGWVHHLTGVAAALGVEVHATNLARAGAGVPEVLAGQLPRALDLPADAAVCLIGVNDVLRPDFDAARFAAAYDELLGALSAHLPPGSPLVTATLHDVAAVLPIGAGGRARARPRIALANAAIAASSRRYGAEVLDGERVDELVAAGGVLSLDRLHPNASGHREIAREVALALQRAGALPPGPVDPVADVGRAVLGRVVVAPAVLGAAAHVAWLVRRAPGQLLRGRVPALRRRVTTATRS